MVYTLTDLMRITGYTLDQVKDRLSRVEPFLGHDLHRGKGVRTIVGDEVAAALRRLVELERAGLAPQLAIAQLREELDHRTDTGTANATTRPDPGLDRDELVQELRRQIAHLEAEVEFLRSLIRPQLPPPRRRWWAWLRHRA